MHYKTQIKMFEFKIALQLQLSKKSNYGQTNKNFCESNYCSQLTKKKG